MNHNASIFTSMFVVLFIQYLNNYYIQVKIREHFCNDPYFIIPRERVHYSKRKNIMNPPLYNQCSSKNINLFNKKISF